MVYGQAVVARDMSVVGRRPLATGKLLVGVGVGHVSGGVERRRNTKKFGQSSRAPTGIGSGRGKIGGQQVQGPSKGSTEAYFLPSTTEIEDKRSSQQGMLLEMLLHVSCSSSHPCGVLAPWLSSAVACPCGASTWPFRAISKNLKRLVCTITCVWCTCMAES